MLSTLKFLPGFHQGFLEVGVQRLQLRDTPVAINDGSLGQSYASSCLLILATGNGRMSAVLREFAFQSCVILLKLADAYTDRLRARDHLVQLPVGRCPFGGKCLSLCPPPLTLKLQQSNTLLIGLELTTCVRELFIEFPAATHRAVCLLGELADLGILELQVMYVNLCLSLPSLALSVE